MKRFTGMKSLWHPASRVGLAAVLIGSILFVGVAPSLAAGDGSVPKPSAASERIAPRLEFAYLRLLLAADTHALHLEYGADMVERVQEWIYTFAEEGEDVSELQSALDGFEAALAESQDYHQAAQAILDAHAGFDEDGRVTDREQAQETIREAGQLLRDARRALKDGAANLRRALRDWRREHRPRPSGSPGATFNLGTSNP